MGGEIAVICVTVTHLVAVLAGNLLKYKSSPYGGEGVTFSWLLRPQTLHPRIVSQFVCTLEGRPPHCDFLEASAGYIGHCAKVELAPPTPAEIPTATQNLKKKIAVPKLAASSSSQLRKLFRMV